jgi:peptide chain release factor subunit 1
MADTLLVDRLDTLAQLQPMTFPLLSLYLNTEVHDTGRPTYDLFLRKDLRERVKTFTDRSRERDSLDRDVARIEGYIDRELKPSTRGLAVFACSGAGLFEAIQLEVPFNRHQLVVSDRPHLYPLARLDDRYPRYAALVVNTNLARIFVVSTGTIAGAEEIQNPKTKHSKAGGWSQPRFQRHIENVHLQHAKEVVERLDAIVAAEAIDHIVVAGDEVIVPLLENQLPERLARKLVNILRLDIRTPDHDVLAATLQALQRKDDETDEAVVHELIGEYRAGGLAVVGDDRTRAALRAGHVDTLVITAMAEQLKGAEEAANDLVALAKQTAAAVRFIENPSLLAGVGGVGAMLRYLN